MRDPRGRLWQAVDKQQETLDEAKSVMTDLILAEMKVGSSSPGLLMIPSWKIRFRKPSGESARKLANFAPNRMLWFDIDPRVFTDQRNHSED